MPNYIVEMALRHDGELSAVGSEVAMTRKIAEPLIANGTLKAAEAKAAEAKAAE